MQTTADEVMRLLRNRSGNINQAEHFRAELRARNGSPVKFAEVVPGHM